jgi:hypothetical protein
VAISGERTGISRIDCRWKQTYLRMTQLPNTRPVGWVVGEICEFEFLGVRRVRWSYLGNESVLVESFQNYNRHT